MIKNYLIVETRVLLRNMVFGLISILGCVMALVTSLPIFTYILLDRSYEKLNPEVNQVYNIPNGENKSRTPFQLASAIRTEMPTVESAT